MSVRIGCEVWEPWINPCFKDFPDACSLPGIEINVLWTILRIGLSLDVQFLDVTSLRNKTGKTVLQLLREDIIDIACPTNPLQLTSSIYDGTDQLSQTRTTVTDVPVLIYKKSNEARLAGNLLLAVLHWELMFAVGVAVVIVAIGRLLTGDFRIALTAFNIFAAILLGVYANILSIELFRALPPKRPVSNFEDLVTKAENGQCTILLDEQDYFIIKIISPHPPITNLQNRFQTLYESGRVKPFYSSEDMVERLDSTSCVVAIHWNMTSEFLAQKYCSLAMMSEPTFASVLFGFIYRKNWETETNLTLNILMDQLDMEAMYRKFLLVSGNRYVVPCESDKRAAVSHGGLSLKQLQDILFFWLFMILISVLLHISEKFYHRCHKHHIRTMHFEGHGAQTSEGS